MAKLFKPRTFLTVFIAIFLVSLPFIYFDG